MSGYFQVLKKYVKFSGRASRKEYWTFFFWNILICLVLGVLAGACALVYEKDPDEVVQMGVAFANLLIIPYSCFILLPSMAVAVRRMHDSGQSGWWIWVPVANFILLLFASQSNDNAYDRNPRIGEIAPQVKHG